MKLWIDDIRTAPEGYVWCKSVNETIYILKTIKYYDPQLIDSPIEIIDLDHDAGDYAVYGGDYVEILKYMEENKINIPIRIHSMNPVGVQNMRRIIERNGWKEIF